jgi:hypothetical protein
MSLPLRALIEGFAFLAGGIAILTWTEPIAKGLDWLDDRTRPRNPFVLRYLWPARYKSPESKHKVTVVAIRSLGWFSIVGGLAILALSHAGWFFME